MRSARWAWAHPKLPVRASTAATSGEATYRFPQTLAIRLPTGRAIYFR